MGVFLGVGDADALGGCDGIGGDGKADLLDPKIGAA